MHGPTMQIQTAIPVSDPQQLMHWLKAAFPHYSVAKRGPVVIVGAGPVSGVMVRSIGPNGAKLAWAFPSIATQILITLTFFAGILPGLVIFLFVWLATKGTVAKITQEVAAALHSGAPAGQYGAPHQMAAGGPVAALPQGGYGYGAQPMPGGPQPQAQGYGAPPGAPPGYGGPGGGNPYGNQGGAGPYG